MFASGGRGGREHTASGRFGKTKFTECERRFIRRRKAGERFHHELGTALAACALIQQPMDDSPRTMRLVRKVLDLPPNPPPRDAAVGRLQSPLVLRLDFQPRVDERQGSLVGGELFAPGLLILKGNSEHAWVVRNGLRLGQQAEPRRHHHLVERSRLHMAGSEEECAKDVVEQKLVFRRPAPSLSGGGGDAREAGDGVPASRFGGERKPIPSIHGRGDTTAGLLPFDFDAQPIPQAANSNTRSMRSLSSPSFHTLSISRARPWTRVRSSVNCR